MTQTHTKKEKIRTKKHRKKNHDKKKVSCESRHYFNREHIKNKLENKIVINTI